MHYRTMTLAILLCCVSCTKAPEDNGAETPAIAEDNLAEAPLNQDSTRPGQVGGLPDDRTPVSEGAIDPTSTQGAGQVLQRFGGLLEQRKFAEAYKLWSDQGRASGLSQAQFEADYASYAEIHSEVGAPGQAEGAAGSIYVDIPFRLYGRTRGGRSFNQIGTVTLRRVNDVPGSTDEQRRWHIYKSNLKAQP